MELLQVMGAAWLSKSVAVAARLGIADELSGGPVPLNELANRTGTQPEGLLRLVRVLDAFQIFHVTEGGEVANSPASEPLRSDHPMSMRHFCMLAGEEYYEAWGGLLHAVRTGESGFAHVFGGSVYQHLDQHPESAAVYDQAMRDLSRPIASLLAREYVDWFMGARRVVDIGGGSGIVARTLLRSFPHLDGVVLDRADVCSRAEKELDTSLAQRLTYTAGDFFDAVPSGADVYVLKNVLHNWNDASASQLLDTVATAMRQGNGGSDMPPRLLVVEPLVEAAETSPRLLMNALFQIVICQDGTRDRSLAELTTLLAGSGLVVTGHRRLPTGHTVVEAGVA